jgi:hypothetical protein
VRGRDPLRGSEIRPRGLVAQQGALGEVLPLLKLRQLLAQGQLLVLERPNPLGGSSDSAGWREARRSIRRAKDQPMRPKTRVTVATSASWVMSPRSMARSSDGR